MNLNLTIIGQAIAFALFVWFCLKYVWPPLTGALRDRQQKIADGLDAAEKSELNLKQAEIQLEKKLSEGKSRAQEIISEAEKRGTQIVEQARQTAEDEQKRIGVQAQEQLSMLASQTREELRKELGGLVVEGVEAVLRKEIDANAHQQYLQELAAKL